jgi:hypothetical protein
MAKITVELEAFYGFSCGFQSHGSEQTAEIEISDKELEALQKIDSDQITAEHIVAAIESGDDTLKALHEQLSKDFYYMVEEYWLYEADNEYLYESLAEHIEQDINDGLYTPEAKEDDGFDCHCWAGDDEEESEDEDEDENEETDDEDYDDEEDEDENDYDLDAYFDWVKEHDHEFAAERVGLDLFACRDDEVNYTITID